MAVVRQVIGGAGVVCGAIFAASYWKLIHISPALENGLMACFSATLITHSFFDLWIDRKARGGKA